MLRPLIVLALVVVSINIQAKAWEEPFWCVEKTSLNKTLCNADIERIYPWTNDSRTSPPPEHATARFHVTKGHIIITIKWKQRASQIREVAGYHMELIHLRPPGASRQYTMTWDNRLNARLENHQGYVTFAYNCCGSPGTYNISPDSEYIIKIQAKPIYMEEDNPQFAKTAIKIPDCRNRKVRKIEECKKKREKDSSLVHERRESKKKKGSRKKDRYRHTIDGDPFGNSRATEGYDDKSIAIYVIAAVCVLVILVLIVVFFLWWRHKSPSTSQDGQGDSSPKRILLISTTDEKFLPMVSNLIMSLQRVEEIQLVSNLRQTVEIGGCGVVKWATNHIVNADIVAFLPAYAHEYAYSAEGICENQQIAVAANVAQNVILTKKLKMTQKKFLVVDLNNCVKDKQLVFCKHYKLASDLGPFFKHVLGRHWRKVFDDDRTVLKSLLSTAQLGYHITPISVTEEKNKAIPVLSAEDQNDLDYSPFSSLVTEERQPVTLNISPNGYPCCDSDASMPYITTDFNNTAEDKMRYRSEGARPKVK